MKEKIAFWFRHGVWSLDKVQDAVEKGVITAEQYKEITGKEYTR